MSRNAEMHFSQVPSTNITRSKFKRDCDHKTTMNTGDLVPIYVDDVLPGDTAKITLSSLVRMTTPIDPVMDNAFMDVYFFFVPNRLVWEHWKEFMGENTTSYWTQEIEYTEPQITSPAGGWSKGTIADYMGIPTGINNLSVSALPFRCYSAIYNEWFRDENLIEPVDLSKGDATTAGSNGTDATNDVQKGGMPAKVAKYGGYFENALPSPQKGPDVYIPLGSTAPVIGNGMSLGLTDGNYETGLFSFANQTYAALKANVAALDKELPSATGATGSSISNGYAVGVSEDPEHSGLIADLSLAGAATVNQLRQAFAVQRMYEKDARGGTRYTEMIRAHFNVLSPDARQQRPEYLGGKRIPINMTAIYQNSATDATSPQGNAAAFSMTIDTSDMFTKSFTEHGWIIGLAAIRTEHTYQQGIERMWSRKNRVDYYFPALANIGEQYIKNKEIYAQGTAEDEEAFGYQEAWAEYRYKPSRISGELRSTYATPLDSWHYGDKYDSLPVLGKDWIQETRVNVDRTLAVQDQDQFIADFYFDMTWTRPMPVYSVPGLLDHH